MKLIKLYDSALLFKNSKKNKSSAQLILYDLSVRISIYRSKTGY